MNKLKNIMVTTDFSTAARTAFPFAAMIAAKFRARIFIVRFASKRAEKFSGVSNEDHVRKIFESLKKETRKKVFEGLTVTAKRLDQNVAKSLPVFESEIGCDLVITAIRRRKGMDEFFLSDTGDKMLALSSVPVFIYHGPDDGRDAVSISHVLVPVCCPQGINDALPAVRFLHKHFACAIRFLFIQPRNPERQSWFWKLFNAASQRKATEARFAELQTSGLAGLDAGLDFGHGVPADVIDRHANEIGSDLIVVGRRGFKPGLAKQVIGCADCSVLKLPLLSADEKYA